MMSVAAVPRAALNPRRKAMVETLTRSAKQFAEAAESNLKSATAAAVSATKTGAKKRAA
jgi:hypothetical protein